MKKYIYVIGISLLISILFSKLSYAGNAAQQDSLAYYYLKLKNLQEENALLITPDIFGETIALFKKANQTKGSGQNVIYRDQLRQIKKNIVDMSIIVDRSKNIFKPLFRARKQAIHYDAKKYAKVNWARGEKSFALATEALRKDTDNDDLVRYVNEAVENYQICEFQALKQKYLSTAIESLSRSKKVDADKWSGVSFQSAVQYIKKTEQIIKESPDDRDKIVEFASKAEEEAKAAEKYAPIIKRAMSDPKKIERILIDSKMRLIKYASMIGIKKDSFQQIDKLDTLLSLEIDKLINERKMLISEMNLNETELKKLKMKVDSCYDSSKKEADFRKKILEIKALFKEEDSEVILSEKTLILRVFGVNFFSDNRYIPPEYFGVFNKISQAVGMFEDSSIMVNAYTDSRGSAKKNRKISAKQAETVRDFLLKNMESKDVKIIATGMGESMPIASNGNEKGRRLNRRIEVVIQLIPVQ